MNAISLKNLAFLVVAGVITAAVISELKKRGYIV